MWEIGFYEEASLLLSLVPLSPSSSLSPGHQGSAGGRVGDGGGGVLLQRVQGWEGTSYLGASEGSEESLPRTPWGRDIMMYAVRGWVMGTVTPWEGPLTRGRQKMHRCSPHQGEG